MTKQFDAGVRGECLAEEYLVRQGMEIAERRYRARDGEIDLVMLDGDTVVFTEVKYRPSARKGDGLMAVTPAKQRRIIHAALAFLVEREWMERSVRFDVVEITASGVLHIRNAFDAAC